MHGKLLLPVSDKCASGVCPTFGGGCASVSFAVRAHLELSTEPRPDHAEYIQSWLNLLEAEQAGDFHGQHPPVRPADTTLSCGYGINRKRLLALRRKR